MTENEIIEAVTRDLIIEQTKIVNRDEHLKKIFADAGIELL